MPELLPGAMGPSALIMDIIGAPNTKKSQLLTGQIVIVISRARVSSSTRSMQSTAMHIDIINIAGYSGGVKSTYMRLWKTRAVEQLLPRAYCTATLIV